MKKKSKLLPLFCVPFLLAGCGVTDPKEPNNPGENGGSGEGGNNGGSGEGGNNGGEGGGQEHVHTWSDAYEKNSAKHWKKCTDSTCKEVNEEAAHDYDKWIVDSWAKDVTIQGQWGQSRVEKQNGSMHRLCKVCGYKQTAENTDYDPSIFDPTKVPEASGTYESKFERDYHIFETGAPTIKFKTNESLDFATKPRKSSNISSWEVSGTFTTENCPTAYKMTNQAGGMKVRGNFTTDYAKKGMRINFSSGKNLFGLNNGKTFKKWVLFADVKDNSMLRNAMAFYMASKITGSNVFVSDFTPVHIYLNDQYWGLYLLGEQKENKSGRIQTSALPSASYDGVDIGYTFELDKYASEEAAKEGGDPTFNITLSPTLQYNPHKGENRYQCNGFTNSYTMLTDLSQETTAQAKQLAFIKKRVENTYSVIYQATKNNQFKEIVNEQIVNSSATSAEACLAKTIDIDSFVDMYILNELVCDPDIGYSSFYLSFDNSASGDKKLRLDCPWDFDSTMGVRAGTIEDSQGMYASQSSNIWLSMLSNTAWFKEKVKAKWNKLREDKVFEKALNMIEDYTYAYADDYKQNFAKWNTTMGNNPETSHELRDIVKKLKHQRQAEQLLYHWVGDRVDYLETQFGNKRESIISGEMIPSNIAGSEVNYTTFKADATKVRIEAETGTLSGNCQVKSKDNEGISGNKYVGDLNPSGGSVTMSYTAAKAGEAVLSVGLSQRTTDYKLTDLFDITVNGVAVTSDVSLGAGTNDFHSWTSVDAAKINLKQGVNSIVFTAKQNSTNLDFVDLYVAK